MATGPVWSTGNTVISNQSLGTNSTVTGDINLNGSNNWDAVAIQFTITDGGGAPCRVDLFSSYDGGTTFDDISLPSGFKTDADGAVDTRTVVVMGHPYIRVSITNTDGSNNATVEAHYAGRQWSSSV